MHEKINQLVISSRRNSLFFEQYIDWNQDIFDTEMIWNIWFMDEELISIYGTPEYNILSQKQKKHLSYLELCQMFYLYSFSESILCMFMARIVPQYKIWTPIYNFLLREQIEEYRHQDMFERALKVLSSQHSEISWFWKWTMKIEALILPKKYFFIIQTVVELITCNFGEKNCENSHIYKLTRDICKIHDIEETRHIEFAKMMLDDSLKEAWFLSRTLKGYMIIIDVMLINHHYIAQENFKKLGVLHYKKLYKIGKNNWKKNALKNFSSKKWTAFLKKYWFVTWWNRWAFRIFLGFN